MSSYQERVRESWSLSRKKETQYVLAVETSCDETACAILDMKKNIRANVIATSAAEFVPYGGVVPEIASRRHIQLLPHVVHQALTEAELEIEEIDYIAATYGPGLVGALLCGLNYAKGMAYAKGIPFLGVNHMEAHIAANQIGQELPYPHICLTVSGGHTQLLLVQGPLLFYPLGQTVDDAAGEAFDKVARALGLPYPGGPNLEHLAQGGNPKAFSFTRPKLHPPENFSFSGIKTAVVNLLHQVGKRGEAISYEDVASSFQHAMAEMLLQNAFEAAKREEAKAVVFCGGVAANGYLRKRAEERGKETGTKVYFPPKAMCTDNGAMVASAAINRIREGQTMGLETNAVPNLPLQYRNE